MESPIQKKWIDKRELAQVVGPNSCFVIKESKKISSICNRNGKIETKKKEV